MSPSVPSKIGKYDVLGVIGRGGMGVVYKAVDPRLDRQVAIKMMTGGFVDDPDLRKRFFREAQSLASLQHPNIVTVYDLGDFEGNPYLVMQLMEGETLDVALANQRKFNFLEKFNIIIQVCNGLAYAHQRFVVHRDIKPANIMLEKDGGTKIFDFGIAHVGDQSVTKTGQMVGTPPYMSPEQINGKTVDARSDLFSLGVVLYQLCTERLPFQGDSPASTFLKILYDPIPPLRTFLPSYPPELDGIIERALAKDPADRYHSADEFALDLGHLVAQFRQEVVTRYMREVTALLEKSDLHKAKELLLVVLRADPQHLPATQGLRDVERRLRKEEISSQVRRLRQQADECVARQQLEAAQGFLEQAMAIDNTDADLRQHAESVRGAIAQARKLREVLKSAESAHHEGDLDIAKQAIEEALQISPSDTQAKALYRIIQREWLERSRQRQIETYLFQARQHISARNFSDALETLKLAEALDPTAPQIHSLVETATAGLEQERRRKEVEGAIREIESALNKDDYKGACQKAEAALARFPEERTIVKLKALADRQRQIEERRQLVEEQLSLARKLLQVNRNEELLASLEATIAKIGPEPRLQSLLGIVTENVQRERLERRKSEILQRAREMLGNQQYDSAIRTLEAARAELKNEPELDELLQFVRDEAAAEKRRREAAAAAEKARAFVAEQKYDDAIRILEIVLQQNTDPDLRIALAETRRAASEYQERMESALASAERLVMARKYVEAVKLLEAQPPAYLRNPSFSKLLEGARSQADRMRRVREAVDQSQRLCDDADYAGAHKVLEDWRRRNGNDPDLDAQDTLIEQRRTDASRRAGEKAINEARTLIAGGDYQSGLDKLQAIAELVVDLPEALANEFRTLRQVAATGLVESRKSQIEQSVDKGELTRAGNILRQALAQFPAEADLSNLGKVVEGETTRRGAAQQKLAEAQAAFDEEQWSSGGELLAKAFASSSRAPAVRAKVIDAFVQAAFLAVETDWRAAEALLKRLAELKPDYDPPSLLRLQIREHEREETVGRYIGHAKVLMAMGHLQEALSKLNEGLKALPDDVTLVELRKSVLERIRQEEERGRLERARVEKETFLRDVIARVEREPLLERRISLLEEALVRFPQEAQLQQMISVTRELMTRVATIVADARKLEDSGKYDEALAQWRVVRTLHSLQSDLQSNIGRVTRLRDEKRAKAKADWLDQARRGLEAADFDRTRTILHDAGKQFPQDPELTLLEAQLGGAIKAREKAEKYLVEASRMFERSRWAKGIDALSRVLEIAPSDAVLRSRSLSCLVKAAEAALASDVPTAHMLLDRAALLDPSASQVVSLDRRIKDREREQAILDRLASVRRTQQGGDLEGARLEVNRSIKAFPEEQRFVQVRQEIERQIQQIEERKTQEAERTRQLEIEREREREKRRQEEIERERIRQKAREEEERLRREEAVRQEKLRAQEAEQRRIEEEKRKRLQSEQIEKERKEAAERERLRAEEAERQRLEDEKRKKLQAEQLEKERKEAVERERIRAEEAERKRQEDEKRKQLLAEQLEKERKEAAERERIRTEEAERKRLEKVEQEKALALQREQDRLREQERLKALEQERLKAEKQRLEEKRRQEEEARKKEEQLRQERELAKKQEKERKAQEKARKREEEERREAAASAKRKQEQEAERRRKEERQKEELRQKQKAQQEKEKQKLAKPVEPEEPKAGMWATIAMRTPAPVSGKAKTQGAAAEASADAAPHPVASRLTPATLKAIYAAAAVLLVVGAPIAWKALSPHTIAIQLTSMPDGSAVTVISRDHSGSPQHCVTPVCNISLPPGKYSVEVKHEGYETAQQEIEVGSNGEHSFPIALVASPPPPPPTPSGGNGGATVSPQLSSLQLRGLSGNAELFVDGKSVGRIGHNGEFTTQVPVGEHQVKVLAKNQNSIIVVRNFVAGRVVSLGRDDLYPPTQAPEDLEWQSSLGSESIDSLEKFLQKYPSGAHHAEAAEMLETKFWEKDLQANTAESYRDYLGHYGQGAHAMAAREELAFLTIDPKDQGALDSFARVYPNSRHRGEIDRLRDDAAWQHGQADETGLNNYLSQFPAGKHASDARAKLTDLRDDGAWQHTNRSDENSLNAYLSAFPEGKHVKDAKTVLAELRRPAPPAPSPQPISPQPKPLKEREEPAIRAVLGRYEQAFKSRDADALLKIWPNMGNKKYKDFKGLFSAVSSSSARLDVQDIQVGGNADTATATTSFFQSFTLKGGGGNNQHQDQVVFDLTKSNGAWVISNVR